MADRWTDERDRDWRDRDWRRSERSSRRFGGELGGERGYGREERSFRGERDHGDNRGYGDYRGRDRVFGERESGADYTGPRYGAGGYSGYTGTGEDALGYDRDGGSQGARNATRYSGGRGDYGRGGRGYGEGDRYFGQDTRPYREGAGQYGYEPYQSDDDDHWRFGFGYDLEPEQQEQRYVPNPREGRGEGGRGFWDRASDTVASWFGDKDAERRHRWDMQSSHRGRGPKGYRRSDERIREEVNDRLTDDPMIDASEIEVTVDNGEVTLSGTVVDREAKHRAERLVERLSGVDHVQNNLRVDRVAGNRPFEGPGANPLTSPGRGFGDSVLEAQARGETPKTATTKN